MTQNASFGIQRERYMKLFLAFSELSLQTIKEYKPCDDQIYDFYFDTLEQRRYRNSNSGSLDSNNTNLSSQ